MAAFRLVYPSLLIGFLLYAPVSWAQQSYEALNAYEEYKKEVHAFPYGASSISGTTATSKTDTDSAFKVLLQGGDLGDILAELLAEVDYTLKTNHYGTWKFVGGVDGDPELYPRLASALDTAQQSALKEQLSSQLDGFDSYKVGIVLSPEGKEGVGQRALMLNNAYMQGFRAQNVLEALASGNFDANTNFSAAGLKRTQQQNSARVLDNRGRMTFSAIKSIRNGVAGPDDISIAITYERGVSNGEVAISRVLAQHRNCVAGLSNRPAIEVATKCEPALTLIPSIFEQSDGQERVSVSVKYTEIDDFQFSDSGSGFSQQYAGTRSFSLSATYGRMVKWRINRGVPSRLDVSLSFEDVKDNAELNDRGLLQATYTLNFKGFEIPIALTWSNKSELVGDSDAELGGHIGIQFRR